MNSSFPCVFMLKQSLQRAVFWEQSTVFCFWIKLMAANERIKKALYSCPPAFVSVGIVSVYKSCLVHIDCWKGWKIPRRISADLLKILLSPQLPTQDLFVSRIPWKAFPPPPPSHLLWGHLLYSCLNESHYFSFKLWKPYKTYDLSSKAEGAGSWNCSYFWFTHLLILKTQCVNGLGA